MLKPILNQLKKENQEAYFYARILANPQFKFLFKRLSDPLEEHLYKLIFAKIDVNDAATIINLKVQETNLINQIFIQNGYHKIADKNEFVFTNVYYDGYNVYRIINKIVKQSDGFGIKYNADESAKYLLTSQKENVDNLYTTIQKLDNIFLHRQFNPLNKEDAGFLENLLYLVYTIDNKRPQPSMRIKTFLENYDLNKNQEISRKKVKYN